MQVAILGSLAILMAIYLALNGAMMAGLGRVGLAHSNAPAADLMGRAFGGAGSVMIVLVVGASAVASINSTLIVGARTTYAAARDAPRLMALGQWNANRGVPARAVLAEGGFAMILIVAGGFAKSGFSAMVDYMTPVYWFFITLSMGALMILRRRHPGRGAPRPDSVLPAISADLHGHGDIHVRRFPARSGDGRPVRRRRDGAGNWGCGVAEEREGSRRTDARFHVPIEPRRKRSLTRRRSHNTSGLKFGRREMGRRDHMSHGAQRLRRRTLRRQR